MVSPRTHNFTLYPPSALPVVLQERQQAAGSKKRSWPTEAAPRAGQPAAARQPAAPLLPGGRQEIRAGGAGAARPCADGGGRVA